MLVGAAEAAPFQICLPRPFKSELSLWAGISCVLFSLNLVAVVGVDVEAEDGVDFDRLGAACGGAEFPSG